MTGRELLDYYWLTWVENIENGGSGTFKEWVEADGEFQKKHLDSVKEYMEFARLYHNMVD